MNDKITITWEAEDGYAGGSRPHTITFPLSDFADLDTAEQIEEYIEQSVDDAFRERCYPFWNRAQMDGLLDRVLAAKDKEVEP